MKKSLLIKFVVMILVFAGTFSTAMAQVTTSTMTGSVRDAKGSLPGASVKAIHVPTGTSYSVSTNGDGRFSMSNMRPGGPYTVEINFVGFQKEKVTDIYLKLGDPYALNVVLSDDSKVLNEVVVSGKKDATMNSKRTGASTTVSKEQIQNLPTLSRSLQDFTRLTPQANGNSFSGSSTRYNSINIDGAMNNDIFGLAGSPAPGGLAKTQPISLDAVQEIQVVLAPYDVSYGNFTGGGINAITRSGTNTVEGSAYFFGRNQKLVGKNAAGEKASDFHRLQYGVRVGAPIVKDKLFLFVNAEQTRDKVPTTYNVGDAGSILSATDAQTLGDYVKSKYGYDFGSGGQINEETKRDRIFGR
jgi:hypothetical protein